jgi:hypothetical protein
MIMKKNIIFGIALMLVSLHNLNAQDSAQINPSVAERFEASFAGARNVFWTSLPKKITQAQFFYNGGSWVAYFDNEGHILTCGRKIKAAEELPLKVQDGLRRAKARMEKKGGSTCQVISIYEMIKEENTKYFVSLLNDSHVNTFSFSNDGSSALELTKPRKVEPQVAKKEVIAKKN